MSIYAGTIQHRHMTLAEATAHGDILLIGQELDIINADPSTAGHGRKYIGNGTSTIAQLVTAGRYSVPSPELAAAIVSLQGYADTAASGVSAEVVAERDQRFAADQRPKVDLLFTEPIALSSLAAGQVRQGVTLLNGITTIIRMGEVDPADNGFFLAAAGAAVRDDSFNANGSENEYNNIAGTIAVVSLGDFAGSVVACISRQIAGGGTLGTDALEFRLMEATRSGQTVFVDQIYGRDDIGARESQGLPFFSIAAANVAAQVGDTVRVGPGSFDENAIVKSGVRYLFDPSAMVNTSGVITEGLIDDVNGALDTVIDGLHDLKWQPSSGVGTALIHLNDPDSNVTIRVRDLILDGTPTGDHDSIPVGPGVVWQFAGRLHLKARDVITGDSPASPYTIAWADGDLHCEIDRIIGTGSSMDCPGLAGVMSPAVTSGSFWCKVNTIITRGASIVMQCPDSDARMWVNVLNAECNNAGAQTIYLSGGRLYVIAERIKHNVAGGDGFRSEGGSSWLTIQKVYASGQDGAGLRILDGTHEIDVMHIEDEGDLGTAIYHDFSQSTVIRNVHFVAGAPSDSGTIVCNGVVSNTPGLTLENCIIDTSANELGNPVVLGNNAVLQLNGTTLIAEAGQSSVVVTSGTAKIVGTGRVFQPLGAGVTAEGNIQYDQGPPTVGQVPVVNADGTWSWTTP